MRPIPHSAFRTFVEVERWVRKGTARSSRRTGDHHRYTLALQDGRTLYARVSHGSGQVDDPQLVAKILRVDLEVSEGDFWNCVNNGVLPPRPQDTRPAPAGPILDGKLVRNLITKVGLTQQEIAGMSREDAIQRWNDWLAG